jgi:hypothetical protein
MPNRGRRSAMFMLVGQLVCGRTIGGSVSALPARPSSLASAGHGRIKNKLASTFAGRRIYGRRRGDGPRRLRAQVRCRGFFHACCSCWGAQRLRSSSKKCNLTA